MKVLLFPIKIYLFKIFTRATPGSSSNIFCPILPTSGSLAPVRLNATLAELFLDGDGLSLGKLIERKFETFSVRLRPPPPELLNCGSAETKGASLFSESMLRVDRWLGVAGSCLRRSKFTLGRDESEDLNQL